MTPIRFSAPVGMALCVVAMLLLIVANFLGVYLFAMLYMPDANMGRLLAFGTQNGTVTALSVIFTAVVLCVFCFGSLYLKTCSIKAVRQFFHVGHFSPKTLGIYVGAMLLIIATGEVLMTAFDSSPLLFLDSLLTPASFWWLIVAIVVVAPLYEEMLFRGFLFGIMNAKSPASPAFLGLSHQEIFALITSSVCFACVHLQYDIIGMMIILALGVLFCHARIKHGLGLAIFLHFLNNALTMCVYLFFV